MNKKTTSSFTLYQFHKLSVYSDVDHYVSGRDGGVSEGQLGSLNLSFKVGDDIKNVSENRSRLAKAMNVAPEKLLFPDQTHSTNVKVVESGKEDLSNTDALITATPGICISTMSADCVPILLYDPIMHVCAAIHSGWKGTVGKIVTRTIEEMERNFNIIPGDLIACIGPSICQDVYQVGDEVLKEVKDAFGSDNGLIRNIDQEGKGYLNLWEANRLQLLSAGVSPENIELANICTYTQSDLFFSARKSKNNTGRFAAGIILR